MDVTLRIKNLSIALEALSRIPGSTLFSYDIGKLLEEEIRQYKEKKEKETQWPRQRPAPTAPNLDDEIPF